MSAEAWFDHDQQVLGLHLAADFLPEVPHPAAELPESLLVLLNTGPAPETFTLPGSPWASTYRVLLDTTDERPTTDGTADLGSGAAVPLTPHSVLVLAARR
jgi:glycogen operon protein